MMFELWWNTYQSTASNSINSEPLSPRSNDVRVANASISTHYWGAVSRSHYNPMISVNLQRGFVLWWSNLRMKCILLYNLNPIILLFHYLNAVGRLFFEYEINTCTIYSADSRTKPCRWAALISRQIVSECTFIP
jgi:hypothetical protein